MHRHICAHARQRHSAHAVKGKAVKKRERYAMAIQSIIAASALAFMYRPHAGLTWDPSCLIYKKTHYCFFMYQAPDESTYGHGYLATSDDGVHFKDRGIIDAEYPGVDWFKCFVHKVVGTDGSDLFVMNHGTWRDVGGPDDPSVALPADRGCPKGTKQCLRFLKSKDLLHWEYLYTLHPDPKWYAATDGVSTGRWDHAYMQADGDGGFVAFPVATPCDRAHPAPGILRSADGLNFTVHSPVVIEWGGVTPAGFEFGGMEKVGGRWYLLGGRSEEWHYSMYTLRSLGSSVLGPYAPDTHAYRLSGERGAPLPSGAGQMLAAWARNYDVDQAGDGGASALISQYIAMPHTADLGPKHSLAGGGHVWMLPLRRPSVDVDGHLRLVYWEGNEGLKGTALPPAPPLPALTRDVRLAPTDAGASELSVRWLDGSGTWDHSAGIVLNGTLTAPASGAVGIAIETSIGEPPNATTTAILMDVMTPGSPSSSARAVVYDFGADGHALVRDVTSAWQCGGNVTCEAATLTGVAAGSRSPFLLFLRRGIFELYVGVPLRLVQTFTYGVYPVARARVGLAVYGRGNEVVDDSAVRREREEVVRAWRMSLVED